MRDLLCFVLYSFCNLFGKGPEHCYFLNFILEVPWLHWDVGDDNSNISSEPSLAYRFFCLYGKFSLGLWNTTSSKHVNLGFQSAQVCPMNMHAESMLPMVYFGGNSKFVQRAHSVCYHTVCWSEPQVSI